MNRFPGLTEREKVDRLRHLAASALAEYGLAGSRLDFLGQSFNAIFRVDSATGGRYVLRLHRFNAWGAEEMRSEFMWLEDLRACGDVLVCEPVANLRGDFVTEMAVEDVPGPHYCTVLRWHLGTPLHQGSPSNHYAMLGELMAKLHSHSAREAPSAGFNRPWRGPGYACECLRTIRSLEPSRLLGRAVLEELSNAATRAERAMRGLGIGSEVFGPIHGDLHGGNVLLHRGTIRAIDFDGCAWGYYLYDLAAAALHLPPARRPLLFAGYRGKRHLPAEQVRHLGAFYQLRMLDQLAYHLPEPAAAAPWLSMLRGDETRRVRERLSPDRPRLDETPPVHRCTMLEEVFA
jgi:Ser/Thr protein kinase RdoA (MazF antagonist)